MDRSVVSLEAFEANLRGTISVWYLKDGTPSHGPGFADQIYTETPPIQRKILLAGPHVSQAWLVVDSWDIVYKAGSQQDWSVILAILQNQTVPFLVCSTPDLRIPPVFFQKLAQKPNPRMTFIAYTVLGTKDAAAIPAHTHFFPSISPLDSLQIEQLDGVIKTYTGASPFNIKEALKDIYSAQAGLVVSRLESTHYSVYWYYAAGGAKKGGTGSNPFVDLIQAYLGQSAS
jgi:hypothetical protein